MKHVKLSRLYYLFLYNFFVLYWKDNVSTFFGIFRSFRNLSEKFVASTGFFGVGKPRGPRQGYPPRVWGGSLQMVTKFKILIRFKVLENEIIFQEFQHFSSPKNSFFLRKISKYWAYSTKISDFSGKLFLKFQIFNFWSPLQI